MRALRLPPPPHVRHRELVGEPRPGTAPSPSTRSPDYEARCAPRSPASAVQLLEAEPCLYLSASPAAFPLADVVWRKVTFACVRISSIRSSARSARRRRAEGRTLPFGGYRTAELRVPVAIDSTAHQEDGPPPQSVPPGTDTSAGPAAPRRRHRRIRIYPDPWRWSARQHLGT